MAAIAHRPSLQSSSLYSHCFPKSICSRHLHLYHEWPWRAKGFRTYLCSLQPHFPSHHYRL